MPDTHGKLTIKQKKFVAGVVQHGNLQKAALDAYETTSLGVARSIGYENLTKPSIAEAIEEGLSKAGLSPQKVFDVLSSNMTAGQGIKATASDSNTAAKIVLDAYKLLDRSRQGGTMGITVQVDGLSKSDLIDARTKLTKRWNDILGS